MVTMSSMGLMMAGPKSRTMEAVQKTSCQAEEWTMESSSGGLTEWMMESALESTMAMLRSNLALDLESSTSRAEP